ncbi:MAG: radical SAM protein, partial [bacterium]
MPLRGPRYLQLFPTFRCNLSCSVCFNRDLAILGDMALDEYAKLVTVMSDIGVGEIDIMGGEPTLLEHICEMIDANLRKDIRTTLSTNGLRPWVLEEISSRFRTSEVQVGVSLYRETESSSELRRYILAHRPVLKSVSTVDSFLPEYASCYLGIPGIIYSVIFMDALVKADLKASGSFREFYEKLDRERSMNKNVHGVFCSGFISSGDAYPELTHTRCPAGTTKLSIKPNG